MGKPGLIVFDESGDTGTLSIPESYSTAGIYCENEHDLVLMTGLDRDLAMLTDRRDYKYKHVAKHMDARTLIASVFREHSSVIVIAIASVSGGIAAEELRAEAAVLRRPATEADVGSPRTRSENLESFTMGVAQGITGIAHSKKRSIDVWWDRRSDMSRIQETFEQVRLISTRLGDSNSDIPSIRRAAEANKLGVSVRFRGACDKRARPLSRIAGVVAGDLLQVANSVLPRVVPFLRENDELLALSYARKHYFELGGIVVGDVAEPFGKSSFRLAGAPMFRAYANRLASGYFSITEPSGRIFHIARRQGRWFILQVPD